jgi:hypothetical protein
MFFVFSEQYQTLRCFTHIAFLKKKIFSIKLMYHFLQTLNLNADETAPKNRKNFSYKYVLELNVETIRGPGEPRC